MVTYLADDLGCSAEREVRELVVGHGCVWQGLSSCTDTGRILLSAQMMPAIARVYSSTSRFGQSTLVRP